MSGEPFLFLFFSFLFLQQCPAAAQMTLKGNATFRSLADCGLKLLVTSLLGADMPSFDVMTDGRHFDELDPTDPETIRYACADADYTLRRYHLFNAWFDR